MASRTIGVVTTSRADFGIWRPVLRALGDHPGLELELYVTGAHLSDRHGRTVEEIERLGFPIAERVEVAFDDDSPSGIARSMAETTAAFGEVFARQRPEVLLVLGDRFEMLAVALAASVHRIVLAHVHGGEVTAGAMDDAFRHALTKLSVLHFVSTEAYRKRVIQLGEEPSRVIVSGAPGLDNLRSIRRVPLEELEELLGLDLHTEAPVLVTYHPVTLEAGSAERDIQVLLQALEDLERPIVFTTPNADTENGRVRAGIEAFVAAREGRAVMVDSLGTERYFSLMAHAWAMVGNSSSGIIEAPSVHVPVVNVGSRQAGRIRGANVVDVPVEASAIREALVRATSAAFRDGLGEPNPYGDGHASERIVEALASFDALPEQLQKGFYDL